MFDEVTKEIKAQLYERARSPLFGGFVIAWAMWNFPSIVALFSSMDFDKKVEFWREFYSGRWEAVFKLVIYPVLSAAVFILVYPFPARWTYHYWHWQHTKLKAIQQRIEDETPMTQAEAKELRRVSVDVQAKMHEQLRASAGTNQEFANMREALLEKLSSAQQEVVQSKKYSAEVEESLRASQREVEQLRSALKEAGKVAVLSGKEVEGLEDTNGNTNEAVGNRMSRVVSVLKSKHGLDEIQIAVLVALARIGGVPTESSRLYALVKRNPIEVDVGVNGLAKKQLATKSPTGHVWLTEDGKEVVLRSGLLEVLEALGK